MRKLIIIASLIFATMLTAEGSTVYLNVEELDWDRVTRTDHVIALDEILAKEAKFWYTPEAKFVFPPQIVPAEPEPWLYYDQPGWSSTDDFHCPIWDWATRADGRCARFRHDLPRPLIP